MKIGIYNREGFYRGSMEAQVDMELRSYGTNDKKHGCKKYITKINAKSYKYVAIFFGTEVVNWENSHDTIKHTDTHSPTLTIKEARKFGWKPERKV